MNVLDKSENTRISLTGFGLMLCFIATPFGDLRLMGRSINLYFYVLYAILWLIDTAVTKRKAIILRKINLWLLCFFVYQIMSISWAYDRAITSDALGNLIKIGALIIIATSVTYTEIEIRLCKRLFFFCTIVLCFYMILGDATTLIGDDSRVTLVVGTAVTEVNYLCYLFIVPVVQGVDEFTNKANKLIVRLLFICGDLFICYCMLFTGSRGGVLGVVVAVAIFAIQKIKNDESHFKAIIAVLFGAILISIIMPNIISLLPDSISSRYEISEFLWSSGGSGRTRIWENALSVIFDKSSILRLLFGYGYFGSYGYFGYSLHNLFVEILFDNGIIGLIILILTFIQILKSAEKNKDKFSVASMYGIITLSLTLAAIISRHFWISILLLMCSINISGSNEKTIWLKI